VTYTIDVFVLRRAQESQGAAGPVATIEQLDVIEEFGSCLLSIRKPPNMNQFIPEITEEPLDNCIVVSIASPAYARDRADTINLVSIQHANMG